MGRDAVDLWLPLAEAAEIWAVQHEHALRHPDTSA
jgi:hypothetical protein